MALFSISGIKDKNATIVEVDGDLAGLNFLTYLSENFFGIKDLLKKYPSITNTKVKAYCDENGIDFNAVRTILNGN